MKLIVPLFCALLFTVTTLAQENLFLERSFWKSNPTITEVEQAIEKGNSISQLNRNMFDAVCYALLEEVDNNTIKHLLNKEGNGVHKITHDGRTYMFWAAYKNNLEIMQWLVDHGAKADVVDSHGYTVINFAANSGQTNPKLYDFLITHGADITATNFSGANAMLLMAADAKELADLDYFVDKGIDLKSVDKYGNGVFNYAAKGGNINVLQGLIDKGIPYNLTNEFNENALFMAAKGTRRTQNKKEAFTYLKNLGLSLTQVNTKGQNLLHSIAAKHQDPAIFSYFSDNGVGTNLVDVDGNLPLHYAARNKNLAVIDYLISKTENIDTQNKKGQTPLAIAVQYNSLDAVQSLLNAGADYTTVDKTGNTLAYYLLESYKSSNNASFEAKFEHLRKAGLDFSALQHTGNNLLHLAAKKNNLPLLQRLASLNLNVNHKNDEGLTPLHLAAMSTNNTKILKYLISKGADVSLKTDFEESVYDLADENELLQQQNETLEFLKL